MVETIQSENQPDATSTFDVLIVDDEAAIVSSLATILRRQGLSVQGLTDPQAALDFLRSRRVHVLITDLVMPGMSGSDLLKAVKTISAETEVIVMTAHGTVENAVESMKEGAYDFLAKPLKGVSVVRTVKKALEKQHLLIENRALRAELAAERKKPIVGTSLAIRHVLEVVEQAAPSAANVLLLGESGTGKELIARAIHDRSPRRDRPFIPVNCAAIPEGILEGELFGYERGAFTGAVAKREGRFQSADTGTLFLDEIAEIPLHVQVKLLRVLQEGVIERLGGKSVRLDLRLVAATNQDLTRAVREGRFREDLFYRLHVIAIDVPPLRDRQEDIPLLVEHFVRQYRVRNQKVVAGVSEQAMAALMRYGWPGNVRELENVIERAVVLTRGQTIVESDLPREVLGGGSETRLISFAVGTSLEEIERRAISETLRQTRGDKRVAAQLLGIATRTIYRKMGEREGAESSSAAGGAPTESNSSDDIEEPPVAAFGGLG